MPLRYTGTLLSAVREDTGNQEYSADAAGITQEGIPPSLFLEKVNDAQSLLQAKINGVYPQEFIASKIINVVPYQQEYAINDRVFINNRILGVEYSYDGLARNYSPLKQRLLVEQENFESTHPDFYVRISGMIRLCPVPTNTVGKIKPTYARQLDDLDIRRGTISAVATSGGNITSIEFAADTNLDALALAGAEYLCVNDIHGNVTAYSIPVGSYNSGSRTLTPYGGTFTPATGETVPVGSFVTVGKYSTTHSKLSDTCDRFVKTYTQMRIMNKDQSEAQVLESDDMRTHLNSILEAYGDVSEDVTSIPILDSEIFY